MNTVIVTGFAGTVGAAFTHYFLERGDTVIGIDNSEWAVAAFPDHPCLIKILGDFSDQHLSCDLLVHCAAYKHVDLIQQNRLSADENNVVKTRQLYKNIACGGILFISTDKAVEPCSYYGETKRKGEEITRTHLGVVVRMGNVTASSGSVIPIWEAAVKDLRPLPITDWGMKRYMQPAAELVEKIMNLYEYASPCETIIPDMGKPLSMREMVDQFFEVNALESDYETEVIGMRPGERLEEQLQWQDEAEVYTDRNGIIVKVKV